MMRTAMGVRRQSAIGVGRSRNDVVGFTLVEVLVAIVILAVALIGMAGVVTSIGVLQTQAFSRRVMNEVADAKMEDLRAIGFHATPDTVQLAIGGSLTSNVANHADSVESSRGQWFYRRWQVAAGPAQTRAVTMRVSPTPRAIGQLYYEDYSTYMVILP